jgi:hypothetical protein
MKEAGSRLRLRHPVGLGRQATLFACSRRKPCDCGWPWHTCGRISIWKTFLSDLIFRIHSFTFTSVMFFITTSQRYFISVPLRQMRGRDSLENAGEEDRDTQSCYRAHSSCATTCSYMSSSRRVEVVWIPRKDLDSFSVCHSRVQRCIEAVRTRGLITA